MGRAAQRNRRSVWRVGPQPLVGIEHYAAFPEALIWPIILAATSEKGCCPLCLAPWKRVTGRAEPVAPADYEGKWAGQDPQAAARRLLGNVRGRRAMGYDHDSPFPGAVTLGWEATCGHDRAPVPCTVLDPFLGAGTTAVAARKLGRNAVGIELNEDYCHIAERRIHGTTPSLPWHEAI